MAEMLQSAEQVPKQRPSHLWRPGQSGNPRGREGRAKRQARIDAIVAEWSGPFGGASSLKPAERDLLRHAAELSLSRPRNSEDKVRVVNAISKIMAQVGFVDKRRKREPAVPTLAEYLARKNAASEATP
jgi:hypothetical protein